MLFFIFFTQILPEFVYCSALFRS